MAEGVKKFSKELLARIAINKVQQRLPVASAEGQTHVAIRAPYLGFVNQRWRIIHLGINLIRVADTCQSLIIPSLFIGLKVDAIDGSAACIAAMLIMSYKLSVHIVFNSLLSNVILPE